MNGLRACLYTGAVLAAALAGDDWSLHGAACAGTAGNVQADAGRRQAGHSQVKHSQVKHGDRVKHGDKPRRTQQHYSLSRSQFTWPSWEQFVRVATLRDHGTRVVLLGTLLLGISAGAIGTFMLLRKRALVGDVVSHASLPGIAIAFIVMEINEAGSGKSMPGLLTGALVAGLVGVLCTIAIRKYSRIKEDAAMAIVLSIFFGFGVALFTIVQNIPTGNAAGLHHFIFGKAASMIADDVALIATGAAVVLLICGLLFKEFTVLCFDEEFAHAQGWPVIRLDMMLMGLIVCVTVIGLQSVGMLLVVALLITPAASARFWTNRLGDMVLIASGLGGLSAFGGVLASALFPRLAAGAIIVLVGAVFFLFSLLFGRQRGIVIRGLIQWRLRVRVGRHDLLRAFYEFLEARAANSDGRKGPRECSDQELSPHTVSFQELLRMRAWQPSRLKRLLNAAQHGHLVLGEPAGGFRLTAFGALEAQRVVRNHRLWEIFLITHADIAPSHVDRDADLIEHVLEPELLVELDALLSKQYPDMAVPPSPHPIEQPVSVGG